MNLFIEKTVVCMLEFSNFITGIVINLANICTIQITPYYPLYNMLNFYLNPFTDSYARSIVFAPVEDKEEVVLTTLPVIETTKTPSTTEILRIASSTYAPKINVTNEFTKTVENKKELVYQNVTSAVENSSKEAYVDQDVASTKARTQKEETPEQTTIANEGSKLDISSVLTPVRHSSNEYSTIKLLSRAETTTSTMVDPNSDKISKEALIHQVTQKVPDQTTTSTVKNELESSSSLLPIKDHSIESSTQKLDSSAKTTTSKMVDPTSSKEALIHQGSASIKEEAKQEKVSDQTTTSTVRNELESSSSLLPVQDHSIESSTQKLETSAETTTSKMVDSTSYKASTEVFIRQDSASINERAKQEDVSDQTTTSTVRNELEVSSTLLPVQEDFVKSSLNKFDSSSEIVTSEKIETHSEISTTAMSTSSTASTTENPTETAKKEALKLESLHQMRLNIATGATEITPFSAENQLRTPKEETFPINQHLESISTYENITLKFESSTETTEITVKSKELADPVSRVEADKALTLNSYTTDTNQFSSNISTLRSESLLKLDDVTKKAEEYVPEFVTRVYYLDDSQTSTVIVTELIPTAKQYDDGLINVAEKSITQETKTSTEVPMISSTTLESVVLNNSTTEKLVLKEGEVIILPSGRVLTEVKQLQEDVKSKLITSDKNFNSSNVENSEYKEITEFSTAKGLTATSHTTESSTAKKVYTEKDVPTTAIKNVTSLNKSEISRETEEFTENESTTEHSIHQTVQLKTSEIAVDASKLEQTTENVTTTTAKAETKVEENSENIETFQYNSISTTVKINLENIEITELPVTTKKSDKEEEATKQTTLKDESIETTTIDFNEEKHAEVEPEKLTVTLTNAVTSKINSQKDYALTTSALNPEAISLTVRPITESTNSEEIRESKLLNETNEATTLQWTTESNNWTFESSNTAVSTVSTEAYTTTKFSETEPTVSDRNIIETTSIVMPLTEEGVRKINLRPTSTNNTNFTDTSNLLTLTQELLSNDGVKSTLKISVKPVTDKSSSDSDESLEVDEVKQPEEIKICTSDVCRKEGEENSKENAY